MMLLLIRGRAFLGTATLKSHRYRLSSFQPLSRSITDRHQSPPGRAGAQREGDADGEISWQESLEQLIAPTGSIQEKSILLQNLATRAPEITSDFGDAVRSGKPEQLLATGSQGARIAEGVAAVRRQLVEDVLPKATAQGPKVASELLTDPVRAFRRVSDVLPSPPSATALSEQLLRGAREPTAVADALRSLQEEARNVFASTPEGLDSPPYTVLRVSATTPSGGGAKYELREYPPFTECVVSLATNANTFDSFSGDEADDATTESLADEVVRSARGFNALARYIFGANSAKQTISMTTPVMTNYDSAAAEQNEYATTMATTMTTMAFPLLSISGGATSAPLADDPCVSVSDREGETVAIVEFGGFVTDGEVQRQLTTLLGALADDGIEVIEPGMHRVLQYNPPYTLPFLRRNELAVRVDLKALGEGAA